MCLFCGWWDFGIVWRWGLFIIVCVVVVWGWNLIVLGVVGVGFMFVVCVSVVLVIWVLGVSVRMGRIIVCIRICVGR